MSAGSPAVSVVVPLFNEEENVPILQGELTAALSGLDYEIIFVDDGSTDGTVQRGDRSGRLAFVTAVRVSFPRNITHCKASAARALPRRAWKGHSDPATRRMVWAARTSRQPPAQSRAQRRR